MNAISLPESFKTTNFDELVIGWGDMPVVPTIANGWWVVPAHAYQKRIPVKAYEQFVALINAGYKVKGLVVIDDLRKVKKEEEVKRRRDEAIASLGKLAITALASLVTLCAFLVIGFFSALSYDPALVAILEDGKWVLLYAWYD